MPYIAQKTCYLRLLQIFELRETTEFPVPIHERVVSWNNNPECCLLAYLGGRIYELRDMEFRQLAAQTS